MKKFVLQVLLLTIIFCSCNENQNHVYSSAEIADDPIYVTPVSEFSYEENEDGGITILAYNGDSTSFSVPSKINGLDVTKIHFLYSINSDFINDTVVSVTLPDTIKEIGNTTFQNFTDLENINLPDSLTQIGSHAFAYCTSLKNISVPGKALNENSWNAFMFSGLEHIEIRGEIETLPSGIFAATNIKEFICPSSLKTIDFQAFSGCENLEVLILNEGLSTVEAHLLSQTKVKEIIIPSSVTNIDQSAFENTPNLEKVVFEGDAPNDFSGFFGASYGTSYTIFFNENAKGFTYPFWNGYPTEIIGKKLPRRIFGDYEIEENETGVTVAKYYGKDSDVIIPSVINGKSVTKIGQAAFVYNTTAEYIKIPDTVTSIGRSAFESCKKLETVELPAALESIEEYAFFACGNLKNITLPLSLKKLGDVAFSNCTSLTFINIPDGIIEMGENVFSYSGINK